MKRAWVKTAALFRHFQKLQLCSGSVRDVKGSVYLEHVTTCMWCTYVSIIGIDAKQHETDLELDRSSCDSE